MSQITVGEDVLTVLVAVGLISMFVLVLGSSFSAYRKGEKEEREERLLLMISNYIRNGLSSERVNGTEPGVLTRSELEESLPGLSERLGIEDVNIFVEIVSGEDDGIFCWGRNTEDFNLSISTPIVYENETDRIPAKVIVHLGRGEFEG